LLNKYYYKLDGCDKVMQEHLLFYLQCIYRPSQNPFNLDWCLA